MYACVYLCAYVCMYEHARTHTHTYCFSWIKPNKRHDLHDSLIAFDVCQYATFRHFRKAAKSDYQLRRACSSAWNNSVPTGRIFVEFCFGDLYQDLLSLVKMWQTVRPFTRRPKYVYEVSRLTVPGSRNKRCSENNNTLHRKYIFSKKKKIMPLRDNYEKCNRGE